MKRHRIAWGTSILFLLLLPAIARNDSFVLHTAIYVLFFTVLGAGLGLVMQTGQLSIGQAAFMGIGAYTCAVLVVKFGWVFWAAWVAAAAVSGAFAFLLGRLTLRIKGVFFAILTFSFGEIVRMIFVNSEFFGGVNGIMMIPPPTAINLGFFKLAFGSKVSFYYLTLVFAGVCTFVYLRLSTSHIGRIFTAIAEGDLLAECCGVDIMRYKLLAFVVGSVMAGMVGGLYAHYFTYISPASFTFVESVDFIVVNVVGGVGAALGPIVGALFLVCVPEVFRAAKEYELIVYAVALILVLCFLPHGVAGTIERRMKNKRKALAYKEMQA